MGLCNVTGKDKQGRMDAMSKMYEYWKSKKNIMDRFGGRHGYDAEASVKNMQWLIEQRLEIPWDSDSPLTDAHYRRIKVEIDSFDRALGGKFSNLAWVVPEGISKQDPTARHFYLRLNEILNHERVNINRVLTDNGFIAEHMLDAYILAHGGSKRKGNLAVQKLRDLRKEMANANPDEHVQSEFISKIEKFVEHDKEGVTLKEFIELVNMDKKTFESARMPSYRDAKGNLKDFNPHVYKAVEVARGNLANMGKVYINGLRGLQKIIALKYTNSTNIKEGSRAHANKDAKRMIDIIEESITDIAEGTKKGGYFPQIQFETIMQIKDKLSKAMNSNLLGRDYAFADMVDNVIAKIDLNKIPAHAKKKNPLLNKYWEKDPLMVLKEYGDQAAQFNKMVNTQITYLDALKHLPKTDVEFQKGLRRFIDEEYTVFTQGTTGRPDWANKAVGLLNAFATARTMGLNITGAVKNAASAVHFYSRVGIGAFNAARKAMSHDADFQAKMKIAEEEAGFLFTDVAKELYTEGLITRDQRKEVEFNPLTGKITMRDTPIKDVLIDAGKWTLDKGLFFHRLTENNQRKWMFRTALHKKYSQLVNDGYDAGKALRFSKAYALKMVNSWAYEYAAHAKSKAVRGEWRTIDEIGDGKIVKKPMAGAMGAGSEVAFHLLHYPMSLFETHYDALKGIHKSILARQGLGDSEEMQYALRYAGVSLGVALSSALLNIDFTNVIENESIDRINRVMNDLTQFDNPDRGTFGLMGEFTGPTLGLLKYLAISQEIIDIEHSDLNKIIFGNVDFSDDSDKLSDMYNAYQLSTFWGVFKNKIGPAMAAGRGRDLITHWLKLYPNEYTKAANKYFYKDVLGVRKPKKKKKASPTNVDLALQVLEGMRR